LFTTLLYWWGKIRWTRLPDSWEFRLPSFRHDAHRPGAWSLSRDRGTIILFAVSGFSEDGQWWWDGGQWIPTSQVMIPDLGIPQSTGTVQSMRRWRLLGDVNNLTLWQSVLGLPFLLFERRAFRDIRTWTLEQLASATTYLLGPGEPMLAGETGLYRPLLTLFTYTAYRDVALAVTAAHVLVLLFDRFDGQPRWVALAARPKEVRLEAFGRVVGAHTTIVVHHGGRQWSIKGTARIAQPDPVVAAWKAGLAATVST
jgi:hypothetical protein